MFLMKKLKYMTLLLIFLSFITSGTGQTFQIHNGDTINVVDAANMKQGYWIYFGSMKNLPEFKPDQKVEEGTYSNSRKNGTWIKYFPDGKVNSEINYTNNRPNGPYKIYYPNGQVEEEGKWVNNRNVGHFTRYYENGEKQQNFEFNQTGKREGRQEYYYENGQLMIEGNWGDGKEDGEIKEYYADGAIKSVKVFNGGTLDAEKTQKFEPKTEVKVVAKTEAKEAPAVTKSEVPLSSSSTTKNVGVFDGNGFNTLYNKNKQIQKKGEFKNGKLWDGKNYIYDENGILQTIEIYKNGRYVGDGVIED
jgi:antitoxin component YwqK of YwqJK toxin-antitoxin module